MAGLCGFLFEFQVLRLSVHARRHTIPPSKVAMLIGGPLHFCVAHLRASCVSAPRSPDIELAGSVSAPL